MWGKLVAVAFAVVLFLLPCCAEDALLEEEYKNMMDSVPGDVAGLLPDGFFDGIDGAASELDEVLDTPFWKELLRELFLGGLSEALPSLLSLFGILLVSALLSVFKDALHSEALSGASSLALSCVMISMLVNAASRHVELVTSYANRLSGLCGAMLPIMGGLLAMGGSGGAAVAAHGGVLMILGVIEAVVGEAFGGIVGISLAMTAANIFSGRFRLSAIARAIRRCFGIFFSSVTALLGFLLSIKIGIASAGDSLAMRGAKMLASNAIPIVGSAVGDSLRTLATSLTYIKSVSGAVGMILVLMLALPVLVSIWTYRAGLVLMSGAAEMLGCDRERELIGGVVSVYGYMLAVVALLSVIFILMLTLFTKSTLAFGGGI